MSNLDRTNARIVALGLIIDTLEHHGEGFARAGGYSPEQSRLIREAYNEVMGQLRGRLDATRKMHASCWPGAPIWRKRNV